MTRILTIGHSTHELAAFLELLERREIATLADVRRHPGSRRLPWFSASALRAELGDRYVHLEELGGRRRPAPGSPNRGWRNEQFRGYADHMASAEFAAGLERLLERSPPAAVMCAEGPWWRCHRRLLADALVAAGHEVSHVMPDGRTAAHELTPFAVVEGGRVSYPEASGRSPSAAPRSI